MRQQRFRARILLSSVLWVGANLLLGILLLSSASSAQASSSTRAVRLATPTPTPPSGPSPDTYLLFYGTLLGALATVVAAVLAGLFVVYQVRKTRRAEEEKQQVQARLDAVLGQQQHQQELEKMHYSERLSIQREERERDRQRREAPSASARKAMQQAQTPAEREQAYRGAIHADAEISQLQILDMSQPLEVTKVYVRLRLHQETRLDYDVDQSLRSAEAQRDPNALLRAGRAFLETRSSAAMTPEDALQKYKRCVILGDPGAGKSTLLKHLALRSVDKQLPNLPDLPIHIVLGEFAYSGKQDLIDFAAARWDERYGFSEDEARAYIDEHLADGSAILLLDALDETVIGESEEIAGESYRRVLIAINSVATRYHKAPIVVTARKAGYQRRTRLNGFTELEVLDFRPEEIKQFITNWFDCYPPRRNATADDLNTRLEQNPRMQSLAANPLLLSLIVMVYEMQQDLPEKRAELYKQCTDTLLFKWDTSRDIRRRREFKSEHKRTLLAEIAWHFHRQGRRYFPEDDLLALIADFLPTVGLSREQNKQFLSEIEDENGLLKEQAHGWHGFLHLTLQEYFVAQYVSENHKLDELLKYSGDPWWEEVLSLYAGYIPDASRLLQKLLAQEKRQLLWKDVFHTHLLWTGRCLAAKPRIKQAALREEVITRLFTLLKKTHYSLTRKQIAAVLVEIGGNDVKARLLAVLKDRREYYNVRAAIARALEKSRERGIMPDLLGLLKDKQGHPDVRGAVAKTLGQLGEQGVVPDLLVILKDKQDDSDVRWAVAGALGQLGGRGVVPDLLAVLKDKQDNSNVRGVVAGALGQLEKHGIVPDLLVMSKDKQEDPIVRWTAAGVLGQLGEHEVMPDLLAVLKSRQKDSIDRVAAARALGQFGERGVVPDLLVILKDRQDVPHVRAAVVRTLGNLGERGVVPDLLVILRNRQEDFKVRWTTAAALGKLGEREALPYLLRLAASVHPVNNPLTESETNALGEMIQDYPTILTFAKLLREPNIANDVHRVLWSISQREKVRVSMIDWRVIRLIRVRRW